MASVLPFLCRFGNLDETSSKTWLYIRHVDDFDVESLDSDLLVHDRQEFVVAVSVGSLVSGSRLEARRRASSSVIHTQPATHFFCPCLLSDVSPV